MIISIKYFAMLREQSGIDQETRETALPSPGALYQELRTQYGFALPAENLRAAINGKFVSMDTALQDGDEVVFIPPVAGG